MGSYNYDAVGFKDGSYIIYGYNYIVYFNDADFKVNDYNLEPCDKEELALDDLIKYAENISIREPREEDFIILDGIVQYAPKDPHVVEAVDLDEILKYMTPEQQKELQTQTTKNKGFKEDLSKALKEYDLQELMKENPLDLDFTDKEVNNYLVRVTLRDFGSVDKLEKKKLAENNRDKKNALSRIANLYNNINMSSPIYSAANIKEALRLLGIGVANVGIYAAPITGYSRFYYIYFRYVADYNKFKSFFKINKIADYDEVMTDIDYWADFETFLNKQGILKDYIHEGA